MTDLNAALNEVVMSAAVRRNVFIVKDDSPKASALSHGFLATVVAELVMEILNTEIKDAFEAIDRGLIYIKIVKSDRSNYAADF